MNFGKLNEILENDPKHVIGNSIFAIETSLGSLEIRIKNGRTEEALEILNTIRSSVEKTKDFLERNYQ